jgi:nitroimidazol reductase NimA-like FMN-containing flavoprotein (pyridoxamine 5'-phosphate oxidase superfamily)
MAHDHTFVTLDPTNDHVLADATPMNSLHEPQLKTLTREECLERLREAVIGRIAYVADGMATVIPVNFALFNGDIVFCTAKGSTLSWLSMRGRLAFEADESRPADHEGWSVLVQGVAREVTHPDELAVLRRGPLRSWLRSPHEHWVRISIDAISGRALHGAAATR